MLSEPEPLYGFYRGNSAKEMRRHASRIGVGPILCLFRFSKRKQVYQKTFSERIGDSTATGRFKANRQRRCCHRFLRLGFSNVRFNQVRLHEVRFGVVRFGEICLGKVESTTSDVTNAWRGGVNPQKIGPLADWSSPMLAVCPHLSRNVTSEGVDSLP